MKIKKMIFTQFGCPQGLLGRLAGNIMKNRSSNIKRNQWSLELLDIQPDDHILEIGCGPGIALAKCSRTVSGKGRVLGLDHSQAMIDMAKKTVKDKGIPEKVTLICSDIDYIVNSQQKFTKIFCINVIPFITDKDLFLKKIFNALTLKSKAVFTYQPRLQNKEESDVQNMKNELEEKLKDAGFSDIKCHKLPLQPLPAICVVGAKK